LPGYDAGLSPELSQVLGLGRNEVLRLLAVAHALLPGAPGQSDRPGLQRLGSPASGVVLYAVGAPLPRVYLAGSAEVPPDPGGRAAGWPTPIPGSRRRAPPSGERWRCSSSSGRRGGAPSSTASPPRSSARTW